MLILWQKSDSLWLQRSIRQKPKSNRPDNLTIFRNDGSYSLKFVTSIRFLKNTKILFFIKIIIVPLSFIPHQIIQLTTPKSQLNLGHFLSVIWYKLWWKRRQKRKICARARSGQSLLHQVECSFSSWHLAKEKASASNTMALIF
jgi:hypothetical protein